MAEAALRDELLDHLARGQAELETSLADLRQALPPNADSTMVSQSQARLAYLNELRGQLTAGAAGKSLTAIRGEVAAAVAAIHVYASDAKSAALAGQASQAASRAELERTSAEARRVTSSIAADLFERKIFDPYLRFASPEDEKAYREREAERQDEVKKALAEQTPRGTLRATDITIEQMQDAGAHGADKSPAFQSKLHELRSARRDLAVGLGATKQSVERDTREQETGADPKPPLSPALLAEIRATGVVLADQQASGHGVPEGARPVREQGRG